MRNILTQFLVPSSLLYAVSAEVTVAEQTRAAEEVFHTFVLGKYSFPLLGRWSAERVLGKCG